MVTLKKIVSIKKQYILHGEGHLTLESENNFKFLKTSYR